MQILTFHSLDSSRSVSSCDVGVFKRGLKSLLRAGHTPVRLADINCGLAANRLLPKQSFAVTFDDGYKNFITDAWPILRRYDIPVSLFVCSGSQPLTLKAGIPSLEGRDMLDWRDVLELTKEGVEIGSHGENHTDMTALSPIELSQSLAYSKDRLQQLIGEPIKGLSYPFGRVNALVKSEASKEYRYAVSDRLGRLHSDSDHMQLPRIETFYFRSAKRFSLLRYEAMNPILSALDIARRSRRTLSSNFAG